MTIALIFALVSLLLTALNDFVFKLFADKMKSRGGFVAVIGVYYLLANIWFPMEWGDVTKSILWGCAGGFFSVTANILLIEAMGHTTAGLCSTIYRLNMVFVIAGAFFLLGENIYPLQWLGIAFALAAIILFVPITSLFGVTGLGFAMALIAAILRAMMGLVYKKALIDGVDTNVLVFITSLFWVIGGILYAWLREHKWDWLKDRNVMGYGALSGILVFGIVFCMAGSLKAGDASKVLPIAQMSFLATFVLGVVFLHERVNIQKLIALGCGIASIVCIAYGGV